MNEIETCRRYLGNDGSYAAKNPKMFWCSLPKGHTGAHLDEASGATYENADAPVPVSREGLTEEQLAEIEKSAKDARLRIDRLGRANIYSQSERLLSQLVDANDQLLSEVRRLTDINETEWAKEYYDFDGTPIRTIVTEAEALEHKPDGHLAPGAPYWNYTLIRRTVTPWLPVPDNKEQT